MESRRAVYRQLLRTEDLMRMEDDRIGELGDNLNVMRRALAALMAFGCAAAVWAGSLYVLELKGGARVFSLDRPMEKGRVLVFHRYPDGIFTSIPSDEVAKIATSAAADRTEKLAPGELMVLGKDIEGPVPENAGPPPAPAAAPASYPMLDYDYGYYGYGYGYGGGHRPPRPHPSPRPLPPPLVGPNGYPGTPQLPIGSNGFPILFPSPQPQPQPR